MKPIAIFYHCLFAIGYPPELLPSAPAIVNEQMGLVKSSGLEAVASEIHCGVNGGQESEPFVTALLPSKSNVVYHGLESRSENLTIVMLEQWARSHPDWYVLYFHSKGATHSPESAYGNNISAPWRQSMMSDLVSNWRHCVGFLDAGAELVCTHFMRNMADGSQHIPAGNFLWVKSDYVRTLPSIFDRARIKQSGIKSLESRYEAEVYWGNGPRLPSVTEWRPFGGGGCP